MNHAVGEILKQHERRSWPVPASPWLWRQEWKKALFLHWQADPIKLHRLLPDSVEVDRLDGSAWVSLVAFSMDKVRSKWTPAVGGISAFDEVNIRTYVRRGTKPGVYFLSIEGGNRISCLFARLFSILPYRYSVINRSENRYISVNKKHNDKLDMSFSVGGEIKKGKVDYWLTERYCVYAKKANSLYRYEVHHQEWPVRELYINNLELTYPRFSDLLNGSPNITHYSEGVSVAAWNKDKVKGE